ncbi:MAG: inositol monophosphatase [Ignavibacteriales bacterium]|nr:inositol monophosphatase [Ignavibacteriales bacterium]
MENSMYKLAVDVAIEAGKFLRMNVGKVKHIERKQGQETNLVTEIDKKAEELIIRRIRNRYGSHDFLGEESGGNQSASEYRWIIDPLDGTTNFTHGLPIYCVSIGLEFRGELRVGAVYDPTLDELFSAEKGKGAFLNGKRISVSTTSKLVESLLVTGFPYDVRENADKLLPHFNNFLMEAQAVRRLGSAALDLCYVACGRFDGFWEAALNPWDMAAGVLILEEAGGKFTDLRGFPSTIYRKELLVSNGALHDQMLEVLKRGMK